MDFLNPLSDHLFYHKVVKRTDLLLDHLDDEKKNLELAFYLDDDPGEDLLDRIILVEHWVAKIKTQKIKLANLSPDSTQAINLIRLTVISGENYDQNYN